MFDLPEQQYVLAPDVPKLSADVRRTARRRQMLASGVHPTTRRPLAKNGETCGTCLHVVARPMGGSMSAWWCQVGGVYALVDADDRETAQHVAARRIRAAGRFGVRPDDVVARPASDEDRERFFAIKRMEAAIRGAS
jgi:hypothetical protein